MERKINRINAIHDQGNARRTRRTAPTQMEGTASGSNYDKTA